MPASTLTASLRGVVDLTPSDLDADNVSPGVVFMVICTGAGNVKIKLAGGSISEYPVVEGLNTFDFQVVRVFDTGTTATGTFQNGY